MKKALILLAILLFTAIGQSHAGVIANPGVAVEKLDRQMLLSIFSMRLRTWPDGQEVRVFVLPADYPQNDRFIKQSLGIFPYQLNNIWDRLVFSGAGQAPVVVQNSREMLQKIRTVPGAIGYTVESIEGETDVKVLDIE